MALIEEGEEENGIRKKNKKREKIKKYRNREAKGQKGKN